MLGFNKVKERGDTLIEVMFAITVFSLVAVGTLSIMNQGDAIAERALETTLVREQVDSQVQALQYLNAAYVAAYQPSLPSSSYTGAAAQWVALTQASNVSTSAASLTVTGATCPVPPSKSFIINTRTAKVIAPLTGASRSPAPTYAKLTYGSDLTTLTSAQGIWVQEVRSGAGTTGSGYVDFYINTCWNSVGQVVPQTIGTIVRLYEPRN